MGMNSEGSAFHNNRGRASVMAFPVRDWERGMMYDLCFSRSLCMGMNSEGSALHNNRGRASVIAFPVRDWERGMMYDLCFLLVF